MPSPPYDDNAHVALPFILFRRNHGIVLMIDTMSTSETLVHNESTFGDTLWMSCVLLLSFHHVVVCPNISSFILYKTICKIVVSLLLTRTWEESIHSSVRFNNPTLRRWEFYLLRQLSIDTDYSWAFTLHEMCLILEMLLLFRLPIITICRLFYDSCSLIISHKSH